MTGSPRVPRDQDQTRVDLGEDLLSSAIQPTPTTVPAEGPEDYYQNGEIMLSEGMLEDAKQYFRKALVADNSHQGARRRLQEIQKTELDRMLRPGLEHTGPERRTVSRRHVRTDHVLKQLDDDLGLQLSERFFVSEAEAVLIDAQVAQLSGAERIDLGIGFLEMGFVDLALRQFRQASVDAEVTSTAATLEAYAFVVSGRPFEATLVLEPLLLRGGLPESCRKEAMYLMGRASEGLGQVSAAAGWYGRLSSIDPEYRDLPIRRTDLDSESGTDGS